MNQVKTESVSSCEISDTSKSASGRPQVTMKVYDGTPQAARTQAVTQYLAAVAALMSEEAPE